MKSLALGFLGGILSVVLLGAVQKETNPGNIRANRIVVTDGEGKRAAVIEPGQIYLTNKKGRPQIALQTGDTKDSVRVYFADSEGQPIFMIIRDSVGLLTIDSDRKLIVDIPN